MALLETLRRLMAASTNGELPGEELDLLVSAPPTSTIVFNPGQACAQPELSFPGRRVAEVAIWLPEGPYPPLAPSPRALQPHHGGGTGSERKLPLLTAM